MSADEIQLGEFDLIRRFFMPRDPASAAAPGVLLGIGDDAALLDPPPGTELVVAVDTIVAGRHFPHGTDARSIGHRAMAVNLSDLAAMGATPAWATLALTLPHVDAEWLERFSTGLLDLAAAHGVALVGGDTTRGPLTVSVQLLGHVPRGTALRRSGAAAGDLLAVTGTLGDAGAGLAFATAPPAAHRDQAAAHDASARDDASAREHASAHDAASAREHASAHDAASARELINRFEFPTPRVAFGVAARGVATAAMDLSDGLVGDLPKLARACGLAAHVEVDRLPMSAALLTVTGTATGTGTATYAATGKATAAPSQQARDWALAAGDDYELLLAVPAARFAALEAVASRLNLRLTAIGKLTSGAGVTWSLEGEDFVPAVRGFDHFA